jgi:hypothetical protein
MRSHEKPNFEPGHKPEFSEEAEKIPEETVEGEDKQEIKEAKRTLGEIFDSHRAEKILAVFKSDEARQILDSNLIDGDKISEDLEQCLGIKDKEEFINKAISSLEPLFKLRENNPKAVEELGAMLFAGLSGFIRLNKRFSYGEGSYDKNKDLVHIHLAPVEELIKEVGIDGIMDLMRDALEKLAKKVKANEKIDRITATSWIIAKKPAGKRLENFGFTLEGEISKEDKQRYHKDDSREIHRASMTREQFLEKYLKE